MERLDGVKSDTLSMVDSCCNTSGVGEIWIWGVIGIIIVLSLAFLLCIKKIYGSKGDFKRKNLKEVSLSEEIDFRNIIDGSFAAKDLYDKLKRACHPDRFAGDSAKRDLAAELSLEIARNRNNLKGLLELKNEAIKKLGINI